MLILEEDDDSSRDNKSTLSAGLRRKLRFPDGLGMVLGIMIGSGIFSSPGVALKDVGSARALLLAWVIAAAVVSAGSLCYAELGAAIPSAGGDAEYLRLAYGDAAAFVFIWTNFWVFKPGSQAIIATVFGGYIAKAIYPLHGNGNDDSYFDEMNLLSRLLAFGAIILCTVINCFGVRTSASVQNVITVLKVILMVAICVIALVDYDSGWFEKNMNHPVGEPMISDVSGLGRGVVACLWAFDGWADLGSMAEELVDPGRTLPRVIFTSVTLVLVLYLGVNLAYLTVLSVETVQNSEEVALDFMDAVGGGVIGHVAMAIGVAVSSLGALHGTTMTGGRIFYAVARDGGTAFPAFLGVLNGVGAPARALIAQCAWAVVLVLLPGSNFATLLDYFGPTSWVFYSLTASVALRLRYSSRRDSEHYFYKELYRPYTMPFAPLPPFIVFAASAFLIGSSLVSNPLYCSAALIFSATGLPVHFLYKRWILMKQRRGTVNHTAQEESPGDLRSSLLEQQGEQEEEEDGPCSGGEPRE